MGYKKKVKFIRPQFSLRKPWGFSNCTLALKEYAEYIS